MQVEDWQKLEEIQVLFITRAIQKGNAIDFKPKEAVRKQLKKKILSIGHHPMDSWHPKKPFEVN